MNRLPVAQVTTAVLILAALGGVTARAADADTGVLRIGERNCTACHAASEEQRAWITPRPAPELSRLGSRIRPGWVRSHLLAPPPAKPDLLQGRSEEERAAAADALTHHLYSSGPAAAAPVRPDQGAVARGGDLFHQIGCVACHPPQDGQPGAPDAVPLPSMVDKWTLPGLKAFLLAPQATHPSGRMPSLALRDSEAGDLAQYLLRATRVSAPLEVAAFRGRWRGLDDLEDGELFSTAPAPGFTLDVPNAEGQLALRFSGWLRTDTEGDHAFRLTAGDGAARLAVDGQWISDESAWNRDRTDASGTLRLGEGWHRVALEFIQRGSGKPTLDLRWSGPGFDLREIDPGRLRADPDAGPAPDPAPFRADPELSARGRALFTDLRCAACHTPGTPSPGIPPLRMLDPGKGCLADRPGSGIPDYRLTPEERADLRAGLALLNATPLPPPSPRQALAHTLRTFRCTACHTRDGGGGVPAVIDGYFTSNGEDLGDEGRLPPRLDGVGDKLQPGWIDRVLAGEARVRPYQNTRMPRFGTSHVGHLTGLFVAVDRHATAVPPAPDTPGVQKDAGRRMAGTDGLSCIVCHRFNRQPAQTLQVLDLATTTGRLNEDWFRAFLRDPNRFNPGTRMPAFWPGDVSPLPELLDGDTERQLAALWTYLADGPLALAPAGLSRKAMELVVGGEAVVYRGKLWEAGFRAVAVGYPGGVNAAFDAEEMRLALLWRGRFLDASAHWGVQGMGRIRPLGGDVVVLPQGSSFAVLPDERSAWPAAPPRDLGVRFRGYQLDRHRQPTLLYSFRGVDVEDRITPTPGGDRPALHRTLTFRGTAPEGLMFRAAAGRITPSDGDGRWRWNDNLALRVSGETPALLRGAGDRRELLLPVRTRDGVGQWEMDYAW